MASHSDRELVEAAFADAKPSATGWFRAPCPFCVVRLGKQDRRRSLGILAGQWVYHCFRCHAAGDLGRAPEAAIGIELPQVDPADFDLGAPEGFYELGRGPGLTSEALKPARRYLASRRIGRRVAQEARIGATKKGHAARRIIVPVLAADGETWLGWVGRSWDRDPELKYLYPRGMQRGELLFNSRALTLRGPPVLVTEGVFDALPHWPNVVACLGKPTEGQIEVLVEARRPLVVALDGDAWEEGEALALRLQLEGVEATAVRLPPLTDPGDMGTDEVFASPRSA